MVYTVNWGITWYLPPIKGTRKLHWKNSVKKKLIQIETKHLGRFHCLYFRETHVATGLWSCSLVNSRGVPLELELMAPRRLFKTISHGSCKKGASCITDTVDGSEIRRSPVEVGSLSDYLQGSRHPQELSQISQMGQFLFGSWLVCVEHGQYIFGETFWGNKSVSSRESWWPLNGTWKIGYDMFMGFIALKQQCENSMKLVP